MSNQTKVTLGSVTLGEGQPKIAVPITGKTIEEIRQQTEKVISAKPDVIEWRIDYFEDVTDSNELVKAGKSLRSLIKEVALLTTFRTKGEGGTRELSEHEYFEICHSVIGGQFTDAIDLELQHDRSKIQDLVYQAHDRQLGVVMSKHDFQKTPSVQNMDTTMVEMLNLGADVPKIAVMPQTAADVLRLLQVTQQASQQLDQPIITMAMGDLGKVSRVSGEVFGSALTFATVGTASAPGQIPIDNLRQILTDLSLKV